MSYAKALNDILEHNVNSNTVFEIQRCFEQLERQKKASEKVMSEIRHRFITYPAFTFMVLTTVFLSMNNFDFSAVSWMFFLTTMIAMYLSALLGPGMIPMLWRATVKFSDSFYYVAKLYITGDYKNTFWRFLSKHSFSDMTKYIRLCSVLREISGIHPDNDFAVEPIEWITLNEANNIDKLKRIDLPVVVHDKTANGECHMTSYLLWKKSPNLHLYTGFGVSLVDVDCGEAWSHSFIVDPDNNNLIESTSFGERCIYIGRRLLGKDLEHFVEVCERRLNSPVLREKLKEFL